MGRNQTDEREKINIDRLDFQEATNIIPTVNLSGALFVSGGGLWFKGFADTYTELGGA